MNTYNIGTKFSGATFSPCEQYRYRLWRNWGGDPSNLIAFCGLNPSTATHEVNDPTVTRCINYAKAWGYSGMFMLNCFAWRDTDPKLMKKAIEPVGIENDEAIRQVVSECSMVVAAWGAHGRYRDRAAKVLELLKDVDLYALRITKTGQPQHPLYLPSKLKPTLWRAKS